MHRPLLVAVVALSFSLPLRGDDPPKGSAAANSATTYDLAYKFKPGEVVRWRVEHRAKVRTTISGTSQTAETESFSVKVWKVKDVDDKGVVTFEHSVDNIQMKQKLTGRQEETYDSTKDANPSAAFHDVAKSVGVTLSIIKIDAHGKMLHRQNVLPQPVDTQITIPLPEETVAIGHAWSVPLELDVKLENGTVKKIKTRQQYQLEDVKNGVATIRMDSVILTPVRDPAIEAQLIQQQTSGVVRFDIEAGRMISQQIDLDKQVNGFRGETSVMHYQTRFVESLLPATQAASKPQKPAGPAAPPALKR